MPIDHAVFATAWHNLHGHSMPTPQPTREELDAVSGSDTLADLLRAYTERWVAKRFADVAYWAKRTGATCYASAFFNPASSTPIESLMVRLEVLMGLGWETFDVEPGPYEDGATLIVTRKPTAEDLVEFARRTAQVREAQAAIEARERAEYERLKAKFEGGT